MTRYTVTVESDCPDRTAAEIERALTVWLGKPVTVRLLRPR